METRVFFCTESSSAHCLSKGGMSTPKLLLGVQMLDCSSLLLTKMFWAHESCRYVGSVEIDMPLSGLEAASS